MSGSVQQREGSALVDVVRVIWRGLPTLLVSGASISVASAAVVFLTPGLTPLSVLLWAGVVAPCFGALVGQVNDLVEGEDVGPLSFPRYLRRFGPMSIACWAVPAGCAAIGLIALEWWDLTGSVVALVPLAAAAVCTVLGVLGAITGVPIGVADRRLTFVRRLLLGLHVAARRPVPVIAVIAFVALGIWAATTWTASIALLVPAPLALLSYAATWTSAEAVVTEGDGR